MRSSEQTNIGIIGLGGVGGFLAGLLCSTYPADSNTRIHLFARGETYKTIKEKGLCIKSTDLDSTFTVQPYKVYDESETAPIMDYLFICVKSYSLPQIIDRIKPCIDENTIIIPYLNGVLGREYLTSQFPAPQIIDACVYIYAKIESPGVITQSGSKGITKYIFGFPSKSSEGADAQKDRLTTILSASSEFFVYSENIERDVWGKFIRISTASTIQTYYNITNGQILETEQRTNEFIGLINEFVRVASALGINYEGDMVESGINMTKRVAPNMTCSLQRDYHSGCKSELDNLVGFIPNKAKDLGIETPIYDRMYSELAHKAI